LEIKKEESDDEFKDCVDDDYKSDSSKSSEKNN